MTGYALVGPAVTFAQNLVTKADPVIRELDFNFLFEVEQKRTKIVERLVEVTVNSQDLKRTEPWVNHELIGSSRMKRYNTPAFYQTLSGKKESEVKAILGATDYDFAFKLDSFLLERLSRSFPNFQKKEADEYGYGQERDLRVVYSLPVRDLVDSKPLEVDGVFEKDRKDTWSSTSHIGRKTALTEDFLSRRVEFLFFSDLSKICYIWGHIPTPLFADKLWKHSPNFVGKEALKDIFKMFEVMGDYKKFEKKRVTPKGLFQDVADIVAAAPVEAAPALAGGLAAAFLNGAWEPNVEALPAPGEQFVQDEWANMVQEL